MDVLAQTKAWQNGLKYIQNNLDRRVEEKIKVSQVKQKIGVDGCSYNHDQNKKEIKIVGNKTKKNNKKQLLFMGINFAH